jgi:hypothetical protein
MRNVKIEENFFLLFLMMLAQIFSRIRSAVSSLWLWFIRVRFVLVGIAK